MERYVRTGLMKSNNSKKSNTKKNRGKAKGAAAYQGLAADNDGDEEDTET